MLKESQELQVIVDQAARAYPNNKEAAAWLTASALRTYQAMLHKALNLAEDEMECHLLRLELEQVYNELQSAVDKRNGDWSYVKGLVTKIQELESMWEEQIAH